MTRGASSEEGEQEVERELKRNMSQIARKTSEGRQACSSRQRRARQGQPSLLCGQKHCHACSIVPSCTAFVVLPLPYLPSLHLCIDRGDNNAAQAEGVAPRGALLHDFQLQPAPRVGRHLQARVRGREGGGGEGQGRGRTSGKTAGGACACEFSSPISHPSKHPLPLPPLLADIWVAPTQFKTSSPGPQSPPLHPPLMLT